MDLTKNTSAFGLLDKAPQEAMQAHGGPYEIYTKDGWFEGIPSWSNSRVYRVKPATKPSIDWSILKKEWRFIARDSDGRLCCYADQPTRNEYCWVSFPFRSIDHLASYDPGTCDWRNSLVERPEGV